MPHGLKTQGGSAVTVSLKYAHVERERRWLLRQVPAGLPVESRAEITDHYLVGTRLRLREVRGAGGVVRKLGHKVRLGDGPGEIACTSVYLDEAEWAVLSVLEAHVLRKERIRVAVGGTVVAVDVFAGACSGLVLAELDRGNGPDLGLPVAFLESADVVAEVTQDEAFTGARLAAAPDPTLWTP